MNAVASIQACHANRRMFAGIALLVGVPMLWLGAPPGTPFFLLILAEMLFIAVNTLTGLYIWALIGPATSTGTPIIGTGPTPPPEETLMGDPLSTAFVCRLTAARKPTRRERRAVEAGR